MGKHIGILTAGGDSPGLNAAIRGIGKTAFSMYDMQVTGIYDGFRGLMENRITRLSSENLSGILTQGEPSSVPAARNLIKCRLPVNRSI